MSTIVLVTVGLKNMNRTKDDLESMLIANLVFDRQPNVDDVLDAFDNEPQIKKRSDYAKYRAALTDGLMTYGVPRLHAHRLMDPDAFHLSVPRITARWFMNIVGRDYAHSDVEYGYITVSQRLINESSEPKPEPAQAERVPRLRSRKVKTKINQKV